MNGPASSTNQLQLTLGRSLFGEIAAEYASARPPYPRAVFEALHRICPEPSRLFELGPGTGLATEPLLRSGHHLTLIEPDAHLADFFEQTFASHAEAWTLKRTSFEAVDWESTSFELGLAATVMHWLPGLAPLQKAFSWLKPGGWWAMWWNVYGDPRAPDDFQRLSSPLFEALTQSPSRGSHAKLPYALDTQQRMTELTQAGFDTIHYEEIVWEHRMDKAQTLALTASFSPILALSEAARDSFLKSLGTLIDRHGGEVKRRFVTPLYLAQRPF